MFGLSFASQLFQGSAVRTWKYISRILYSSRFKSNNIGRPAMPRPRRRHHSRSRSRSRSHSHDKDRDVKRRRIDQCESPNPKRSVSCERDVNIATESKDQVETLVTDVNNGVITDVDITESIKTTSPPNTRGGSIPQPEKSDGGDVENKELKLEDSDNDCSQNETTIVSIDLVDDSSSDETGSDTTKIPKTPGGSESKIKSHADHQQKHQEREALKRQKLDAKEQGKQEKENKDSDNDCSQNETSIASIDLVGDDSSDEDAKTESDTAKNSKNPRTPRGSKAKIETQVERQQKHQEREALKKQKLDEKERRRQEKEKIKEEKLKEKHEKQEQKQKELEMKQKEKATKEEMKKQEKEQKRLEKEKKEELRKKEKEQEKLRKQQEIDEKNKEKQKQEEQKLKAATAFVNFFVPKKVDGAVEVKRMEENNSSFFMPFEVKSDMKLPPARRTPLKEEEKEGLLQSIISPDVEASYLKDLKVGKTRGVSQKTWKLEDARDDDDVVIIEGDLGETICEEKPKFEKMRTKFLKFHENRRPAYYGTWRKNSKCIKGRKPLVQDIEYFDYEVDSDDDWEEEEQGESLENGSEDEDKENEAENDDYEVDNDFFVPHGHLSDDEVDNEEVAKMSPESLKQKLKLLKDEFDHDMQSKTQKIKPRSIGCIWYKKDATGVDEAVNRYLQPLAIITIDRISIKERNLLQTSRRKPTQSKEFPPSLLPIFIKLLHGNTNKKKVLIDQFVSYLSNNNITIDISKSNISKYITQMAQWMKGPEVPMKNKFCWLIRDNISKKYNYNLNLPNTWETSKKSNANE